MFSYFTLYFNVASKRLDAVLKCSVKCKIKCVISHPEEEGRP